MTTSFFLTGTLLLTLSAAAGADGVVQTPVTPRQERHRASPEAGRDGQNAMATQPASISARLVDQEMKAKKASATIEVQVSGLKVVDPASVNELPKPGQGHLHYKLDDGPVIATTAVKLSYHGLKPGPHTISVALAGNDHSPLGPTVTLNVAIP